MLSTPPVTERIFLLRVSGKGNVHACFKSRGGTFSSHCVNVKMNKIKPNLQTVKDRALVGCCMRRDV